MKNPHPILSFRISSYLSRSPALNYDYSVKTGIHTAVDGNALASKSNEKYATMITETREAADTSESS